MNKVGFEITQENTTLPLLIIDKESLLGSLFVKKIYSQNKELQFICAGGREEAFAHSTVSFIEYRKKQPKIPDIEYSHIVIFFHEEKDLLDLLPDFLKKAEEGKSKIFVIASRRTKYKKDLVRLFRKYEQADVVFIGDLFGSNTEFDTSIPIHRFLIEARHTGRLGVLGMGVHKTYSIYEDDALDGLIGLVFSEPGKKVYFIYPKNSPTELSLAWIFQKLDPTLLIDFIKVEVKEEDYEEEKGEYIFGDTYPLSTRIKEALTQHIPSHDTAHNHIAKKERSANPHTRIYTVKSFMLILIAFLIVPFLITVITFVGAIGALQGAKYALQRGSVGYAFVSLNITQSLLRVSASTSSIVHAQLSTVGQENMVDSFQSDVQIIQLLVDGATHVLVGVEAFQQIAQGSSQDPEEELKMGIYNTKQALLSYQKLQAEYKERKDNSLLLGSGSPAERIFHTTEKFDTIRSLFENTAESWPELAGFKKMQKYLILFQNNMELRPGGGFIGSYGLLSLEKGKLEKFSIHDVYDADGQLKAHIEPPFAIRRHLPSVHWYLRDSNFNVDFSKGASVSAYLLNLETKDQVDGVIGIDTTFVKNLLRVTGPVYVADYKETVNHENFYALTQQYVHKDFFPGSTQKKDFLRSLFNALEHEALINKRISYIELLDVINTAIEEKHLLFAFSNTNIQKLFDISNASGSLYDTRQEKEGEIQDFLAVREANLGVNKVNYFIKRKISQDSTVYEEGRVESQITLMYKNSSEGELGGDYKTYIQLVVPQGTRLSSIAIDGIEEELIPAVIDPRVYESKRFEKPAGLEVEESTQDNKIIFGFLTTVKKDSLQTIAVRTVRDVLPSLSHPAVTYSYKFLKQPGTDEDTFSFSLRVPDTLKVVEKPDNIQTQDQRSFLNTQLVKDIDFNLQFSRR